MMQRMWINQPSTLQPLHHLHGRRVLALAETANTWRIYFLSGETISQQVPRNTLSEGWPSREVNLYYISGTDPNDSTDDYTLFAVAKSPQQAHAIWKRHWWEGDGAPFYNGELLSGAANGGSLLIYELDYDPDSTGAIPWQDLELVAHVNP